MDSVSSPQDVYARHLASRRGYPLWTPEPSMTLPDAYREQGLKIGDVGVVVPEDGSFDVFFNICLPATHSLHRPTGVPNNFTPIQLEDRDIAIFPEAESVGRIISTSSVARVGAQLSNENTTRIAQPAPLNYEFTLSSKEGALLILPEGAERYYLRNQRPFLEEAIKHAIEWYNFAEERLGRIISHDSLYLITGFYKARSWSLASYQQAPTVGGVYAQFKAVEVGGGNISRSYTWETTHALDWRVGPSDRYYNGIPNQSVFIQGFKIAVRSSILGSKRVRVKADMPVVRLQQITFNSSSRLLNVGTRLSSSWFSASSASTSGETDAGPSMALPEESSDSSSIHEDSNEDIVIQHIPQVPKPFHPSDIINQYLLRSYPSAEIAITHDIQWCSLLESELLKPEEVVQECRLEALVCNMLPVFRGGVVYLQNFTSLSGSNADSNPSDDEVVDAQVRMSSLLIEECDPQVEVPRVLRHVNAPEPEAPPPPVLSSKRRSLTANKQGYIRKKEPDAQWPREASNIPVMEGQLHDPYESKSSVPQSSILKGSKNAHTSGMFKERFVSATPKLSRISLPSSPASPDMRQPQKPATVTSSSSRANPTAGQPAMPLKSILKGGKNAHPHDAYESGGKIPTAKKAASSVYNIPNVPPPGSRLVPMKQPAFDLIWMLLPYDPQRSRFLRFDIAFPVDYIAFQVLGNRTKLSDDELNKPAANDTMTKMLIAFEHGPFSWEVEVQNSHGIRCRDVFEAIYKTFNEQLMLEEKRLVRDRRAVEDAFRLRCKLAPGLPEVEQSLGWKRVDVLLHRTIFLGLTQPKPGGDWVLNLGTLPHVPGLS